MARGPLDARLEPASLAVVIDPAEGFERVTVKPSSSSRAVSPLTGIDRVRLVSPSLKVTVPDGKLPPKSAASAGLAPEPVTT